MIASFSNADVFSFDWVNDDRIVFNVADLALEMAERKFGGGLFAINRDGTSQRQLVYARPTFMELNRNAGRQPLEQTHGLLAIPRGTGAGDTIIVGEYVFNLLGDLDTVNVKRLNVVDGSVTTASLEQPAHAMRWWFDPKGEPRVVLTEDKDQEKILWRAPGKSSWEVIAAYRSTEAPFVPRFVDANARLFVAVPEGPARTAAIRRFDFATGKPEAESLVRAPGFDFAGSFIVGDDDARWRGVRVDTDAESTVWFEPRMKEIQGIVDRRFPGHVNHVTCHHCEDPDVVLVHSWSDQDPGSFWIYRPKSETWDSIGAVRPDIDPKTMGRLDLHRITARDGRDLPVWVTVPPDKLSPGTQRPAVVLVHGGPFVRGGEWRWHASAQFLASRGYVVIEPEFRGSTGYGEAHFRAGWKHWGDTMQDDVADAADWAAKQGLIDPKRVCIAGASYGGYSTLMSLVRFPDKYRCGVAWVAVTDPRLLFEASWQSDLPEEWRRYGLPVILGDPIKDAAMLRASAPSERAAEIRAPLLLAFGRDDRRVPIEHGTKMRAALQAAGHPPEWIVYEGEGHGWQKVENQYDFWRRVEAFLAKQLQ
ncbi:MAG TPA: prolyl oligopeptidase family serine peptidase [Caldimonas sp.]|nr:prolyl oligopeptidase family serine peptidase [Caldimonas sp.]